MVDTMLYVIGAVLVVGIVPCIPQCSNFLGKVGLSKVAAWSNTRRMLLGLCILTFGGLMGSTWTMIIHSDLIATGATESCTSAGCGALIGDHQWNTMPIIGLEWGLVGVIAFTLFFFISLSLLMDFENNDWNRSWLDFGTLLSGAGLIPVAWLVSVELFLHDDAPIICPFCTLAHIAAVASFVTFFLLRKQHDGGFWDV